MKPALQPKQTGLQPDTSPSENADDITPINEQAARFRDIVEKLTQKAELIEGFLNSPNLTDGPLMDKPVKVMERRVLYIRKALESLGNLDMGDEDFGEKLDAITKEAGLKRN